MQESSLQLPTLGNKIFSVRNQGFSIYHAHKNLGQKLSCGLNKKPRDCNFSSHPSDSKPSLLISRNAQIGGNGSGRENLRNQKISSQRRKARTVVCGRRFRIPRLFVCVPYSTVKMPPRILSEYPARSIYIYIYIAKSNIVIDNRQDFIPNNNRKGNKRRRRQPNDTYV